jgi:ubiquinone/menaquinone biosynthesis C-methylase UbiE
MASIDRAGERTWDARATVWDQVSQSEVFVGFRDQILERAEISPDDVVLDLGCGTGLLSLEAARLCRTAIGVDHSGKMLARLRTAAESAGLENIVCLQADMRCLPLDDASVDVVVSCYALHHLTDDGKELAIAEAKRVLRPAGRLVVIDMMFGLSLDPRDRQVIIGKIALLARKGPSGLVRIARNVSRLALGRWEQPATTDWWRQMLERRRFDSIAVETLINEAGCATAKRDEVG